MRGAVQFAAAFALSVSGAHATPCDTAGLPDGVEQLGDRLAKTSDRGVWATVAQDAANFAADPSLSDAVRACALYQAGAAHFFLSTSKADRRRHAADAVRYMLGAAVLAPAAMQARQPVNRLRTAWKRIGRVEGWLTKTGKPVAVTLDPVGEVVLEPADPAEWVAACGDTPSCRSAAVFRLPRKAMALQLRAGRYRVTLVTPCGERRENVDVTAGALPLPKAPGCPVRLMVRDGSVAVDGVEVLGPGGVTPDPASVPSDLAAVTVSARGYNPKGVRLPPAGGDVPVELERCPVELQVFTEPAGAEIQGDGPAPWGPRTVRASHAGHAALETVVEVPRPARCAEARHVARVKLPRPVLVAALAEGRPTTPSRLTVGGEDVNPETFARPPGRYPWQAWHPMYGMTIGELEVPPCVDARCAPVSLGIEFRVVSSPPPKRKGASRWSYVLMGLGGLSVGGGLVSGAAAFNTQDQIDAYGARNDEAQPIDDLVDRRDTQAQVADGLVIAGASAFAAGFILYLATVE